MAGGGGTRLWPASTSSRPKQLIPDVPRPGQTLLAATIERLEGLVAPEDLWIVTTRSQVDGIRAAAPDVAPGQILVEPLGRNTAPCLALAARHLAHRYDEDSEDVTMIALPADHHVRDPAGFRRHLRAACLQAESRDTIATLGIEPDRPETGYGYMERDPSPLPAVAGDDGVLAHRALRFVEKPDRHTAERYLAEGHHAWNAGIFCMPLRRIIRDFDRCIPATWRALDQVRSALLLDAGAVDDATAKAYAAIEGAPIDTAVMEQLDDIVVVPAAVGWTDLGAWPSMVQLGEPDPRGNVILGQPDAPVLLRDSANCLLWSEGARVGVIGLDGVAVIVSGDAVLVCPLERAQEVKAMAKAMNDLK